MDSSIHYSKEIGAPDQMREVAKSILTLITPPAVVLVNGPLGAGKTELIRALARVLGIEGPILSPTFSLMQSYPTSRAPFTRLIHLDAYRITDGAEWWELGLEEMISEPGTLTMIEWGDRVSQAVREIFSAATILTLTVDDRGGQERRITLSSEV